MTHDELLARIELLKTDNGGWTKEAFESLGVSWPPKKGWKKELLNREWTNDSR